MVGFEYGFSKIQSLSATYYFDRISGYTFDFDYIHELQARFLKIAFAFVAGINYRQFHYYSFETANAIRYTIGLRLKKDKGAMLLGIHIPFHQDIAVRVFDKDMFIALSAIFFI